VTCEEVNDDEEDMVAIRGVRWREKTQLPFNMLLEEIDGTLNSTSSPMDNILMDDETDDEINQYVQNNEGGQCSTPYQSRKPPTVMEARLALGDLENLLRSPRKNSGHQRPEIEPILKGRLESMEKFLWKYVNVNDDGTVRTENSAGGKWTQAALETALFLCGGPWLSRNLWAWSKGYIDDRNKLPTHEYGRSRISRIEDEYLAADIKLHLQGIGKYIQAQDIVTYLKDPEVQMHHGFKKTVSLATAQ
jgi:hypothetical protein